MNDYKKVTDEWKSLVGECKGDISQAIGKWHHRLLELGLIEPDGCIPVRGSALLVSKQPVKPRRMLRIF